MKRASILVTTLSVLLYLGATTLFAQGHSGGHAAGGVGGGNHGSSGSHETSGGGTHGGAKSTTISSTDMPKPLQTDTKLAQKLEGILGISGSTALQTLQTDAAGFRNLGQFVAAVHVSKNLGISFDTLKCAEFGGTVSTSGGTTTCSGAGAMQTKSLGSTIRALDPKVDAKGEAKKGSNEATRDLKEPS